MAPHPDDPVARPDVPALLATGWYRWLGAETAAVLHALARLERAGGAGGGEPVGENRLAGALDAYRAEQARLAAQEDDEGELRRAVATHERRRADELAARVGLGPLRTAGDHLVFLARCGLAERAGPSRHRWRTPRRVPVPLPEERLPLTPDERAADDAHRWRRLHDGARDRVLEVLESDGASTVATTLAELARRTGLDPEAVRHAAADLHLHHWETEADVEHLGPGEPFALAWAPVDEVLGLFAPAAVPPRRTTTLAALAAEAGAAPDDARRALLRLLGFPGVRASADVAALADDEAFELEVDFVAVEP